MTEFIVVAVFVLLPLFLLMPIVAQLISQKQDVELGARYVAWERTAWSQNGSGAQKSDERIAKEVDRRIFARDTQPIVSEPNTASELDPFSRRVNGERKPLVQHQSNGSSYAGTRSQESSVGGFVGLLGGLATFVPGADIFHLNRQGLYRAKVSVPLIDLTNTFHVAGINMNNLDLSANSALLTDSWTARGTHDAQSRVRTVMPTELLDNPIVKTAQSLLSALPIGKELDSDCLDFGRVDLEPLPSGQTGPEVGQHGPGFPSCNL